MGDGQHVWAAAEWLLMIRSMFVREEDDRLILCSGIPKHWLVANRPLKFGPTLTGYGALSIEIEPREDDVLVRWRCDWRRQPKSIEVRLPCSASATAEPTRSELTLQRMCEAQP